MKRLLDQIAKIEKMERGKLCQMSGRSHYNHQTWQDGSNMVRYVATSQTASVQEAIDGYTRFKKLVKQYADEVIRITRNERKKALRQARIPQKSQNRP